MNTVKLNKKSVTEDPNSNRDEYCEIKQQSVPEDPSVAPEVSFQPLDTAEVCKVDIYSENQKETISKGTTD